LLIIIDPKINITAQSGSAHHLRVVSFLSQWGMIPASTSGK
jgi:hypothetical protein